VRVELVDRTGSKIPYEMSRPLSRRAILKLEMLRDMAGPGCIREWRFKGTSLYVTMAAEIDAAIRGAALCGRTLYVLVDDSGPALLVNS
jgi:hypothetical protein